MFSGCDSIEEFSGKFASEDGYTLIHNNNLVVFAKACGIEEYTIPEYVTHIEERAFANCSDISLFTFKSTTPPTLGADVFEGIDNLQISIPVEAVEAYLTCDWPYEYRRAIVELADINNIPDSCRLYYTTKDNQKLNNYPEDGYSVLSHTYADGQGMVVFYSPLTSIGDGAFCDCGKLTSVTIPDSVTSIGEGAFLWCSSLKSVNIPDRVTSIGKGAFHSCSSLTSVTIPDSVTSIGGSTFEGCSSLTSVTIPDRVTSIGNNAFYCCNSLISVTIGDSVTSIGDAAFGNCSRLTSVTIPDSVTSIGVAAFSSCGSLTSVTIPDSVTSIGHSAFAGCSSLTSVTIGNSVTSIGRSAFAGCSSLTSVTIGSSVISIGDAAFEYCSSLTSVTIPDSVTLIGYEAFSHCYSLAGVYCEATTPPSLGGGDEFYYNALGRKIFVPNESVEAYKSADGWADYADSIVGYDF